MCQAVRVHEFEMLFMVLKMLWLRISSLFYGRTDCYECKILNVKLVVKYCNECNGKGEKKTVRPWYQFY